MAPRPAPARRHVAPLVALLALTAACHTVNRIPAVNEAEPDPDAMSPAAAEPAALVEPPPVAPLVAPDVELEALPIPGTAQTLEIVRVPAGRVRGPDGDVEVGPFWMGRTEITWDLFDVFLYGLDGDTGDLETRDVTTRPSRPYISIDRGFGHNDFPALSMSLQNARAFCAWLSQKTGRTVRLPTEAEWEHAACAGSDGRWCFGDDPARLDEYAWYAANSSRRTRPVGVKLPNAWGLVDVHGNVAEWALSPAGNGVVRGGSYLDQAEATGCDASVPSGSAWNASDPQIPKSRWWLADAPFVGMRVLVEDAGPR